MYSATASAKILILVGRSELYWFSLFLLFGPFLAAYVLMSAKYKEVLSIAEKRRLIMYQIPICASIFIILSLDFILT